MTIGDRIREERDAHGLRQPEFAALVGKSRKTVIDWEKNKTAPDASILEFLAGKGFDVYYIVTGIRLAVAVSEPVADYGLTPEQISLLDNYEHCSKEDKSAIKRMAFLASKEAISEEEPPARSA